MSPALASRFLASSLSYFIFRMVLPDSTTPPKITAFQPINIPGISDLPFWGEAFFSQTPLTYLALAIIPITIYALYRTPVGLAARMAGENPVALEAQGINVLMVRTGAVMIGSAIMAIGGAYLTISAFDAFFFGMINGRGWICIALVIFASWKPGRALFGALLFAGLDAFQVRAQQLAGGDIPVSIFPNDALSVIDCCNDYYFQAYALSASAIATLSSWRQNLGPYSMFDLIVKNALISNSKSSVDNWHQ